MPESFASLTNSLKEAAKTADYVIEAILEKLSLKRKLFADLDRIAPDYAILATNSSTIVSSKIADATKRPDKICNLHFFNPALVMKLVEVVQGPHTSDETIDISRSLGSFRINLYSRCRPKIYVDIIHHRIVAPKISILRVFGVRKAKFCLNRCLTLKKISRFSFGQVYQKIGGGFGFLDFSVHSI